MGFLRIEKTVAIIKRKLYTLKIKEKQMLIAEYIKSFIVAYSAYFIVDNAVYLNTFIYGEYEILKGHSGVRWWDSPLNHFKVKELSHIFETLLLTLLFAFSYLGLPFNNHYIEGAVKGLVFGLICFMLQTVYEALNAYINTTYPFRLIRLNIIRNLLTKLTVGLGLGLSYSPWM